MNYAPIIIPTLCRFKHFKRCVESLSKCTNSVNTQLYVFLDYPKKDEHFKGYNQIKDYSSSITGFKSVFVVERVENYGAVDNLYDAINHVLKRHDRFILSEDDNEFSPNFLDYINLSLDKYAEKDKVIAVTGYNRMIDTTGYDKNIYAAISYSAWGVGFLREDFQYLSENVIQIEYAKSILLSWKMSYSIYKRYPSLLRGLLSIVKTGHVTGDTLIVSYMVLNQKYCIWPTISKVRNHGFDGGGEHFGSNPDHPLLKQVIDEEGFFLPDDITIAESSLIRKRTRKYAKQSFVNKIIFGVYIPLRYLIYRFTGKIIYK